MLGLWLAAAAWCTWAYFTRDFVTVTTGDAATALLGMCFYALAVGGLLGRWLPPTDRALALLDGWRGVVLQAVWWPGLIAIGLWMSKNPAPSAPALAFSLWLLPLAYAMGVNTDPRRR